MVTGRPIFIYLCMDRLYILEEPRSSLFLSLSIFFSVRGIRRLLSVVAAPKERRQISRCSSLDKLAYKLESDMCVLPELPPSDYVYSFNSLYFCQCSACNDCASPRALRPKTRRRRRRPASQFYSYPIISVELIELDSPRYSLYVYLYLSWCASS